MPLVFVALFSFLGSLVVRLVEWFLAAALVGTVRTTAIYVVLISAISFAVYSLVSWVNQTILDLLNSISSASFPAVAGILSMMPQNLPLLITTVISYYTFTLGIHVSIEVAKFKARWAENSLSGYTKK